MHRTTVLVLLGLLTINLTFGQDQEKYSLLVKEAKNFYDNNEYLKSGQKYSEAFNSLDYRKNTTDRYNAACSWALVNKNDSSFVQLFQIAENGNYTNLSHLTADTDLSILHSDKRWDEVLNLIKANIEKEEANLDKPLVAILDTIYQEDQGLRRQIKAVEKKYGKDSDEIKAHWKMISEKDSMNLIIIEKILDERGWLGADIISKQGNKTLFLVIQHSDLETQVKYLPMMREAVVNGNALSNNLALLEDRVSLRQGKRQIYGSQIGRDEKGEYFVRPLIEPENVNQRRKDVGLHLSIEEYAKHWNITWNVEKHKERTAKIDTK
ncbi:MAG: hypothetical protein GQ564_11910 [Bacteroidales bacterium]|nr:hypothetical protein [Bacteroidales bacterium]